MESLCRLCGSEDGIKIHIFEQGTEHVRKIHKVLPITVNEHDPFPKLMCHRCTYKVNEFFEFRSNCIKAQETFKKNVPWLRNKQPIWRNQGDRPMVEIALNSVNTISPNEKQMASSNGYSLTDDNFIVIDDDDSPPYDDHSETKNCVSESEPTDQIAMEPLKPRKPKSRSLWDTKKRKKKHRKPFTISEVFSTTEFEFQSNNDIENEPLCLSSPNNFETNSCVENNSCPVRSPKNELNIMEKGILTDDNCGENIALPKYILVTNIPRVGNVYTCERCGRTFLNSPLASQHTCGSVALSVEDDRPKEELQHQVVEPESASDFYECDECGHVFTRQSQLMTHRKKHNNNVEVESSSDDNFKPFNKRKKHHKKRPKQRLLNTDTFNSTDNFNPSNFLIDLDIVKTGITRHALLSSDSE